MMKRHTNFIDRLGERYLTNEGCWAVIIEYISNRNCTIKFEETGNIVKNIGYNHVKKGNIRNPFHKSIFGVGYNGVGKYIISINGKRTKAAQTWKGILERCYSDEKQEKYPSYKNVDVFKEWHNYQNFAKWFEENYIEDFHLDKDILSKNNKIYSPETCAFVPREINALFSNKIINKGIYPTGVSKIGSSFKANINKNNIRVHLGIFKTPEEAGKAYVVAKELWIKEVADKWKPYIKPNVYQAMYTYKVEITD